MGNLTKEEANTRLKGTFAKDKHEILFKEYMINYNNLEEIYKKGTIIFKEHIKKTKNPKINIKKKQQAIDDIKIKIEELEIIEEEKVNTELSNYLNLVDKLLTQDQDFLDLLKLYNNQNIFISHEDMINDDFWKKFCLS